MAKRAASSDSASPPAKAGLPPVVVMHGPERYTQTLRTNQLRRALVKLHGDCDTFLFDGQSADAAAVLDELRSPNLMMTHKLVIIDNAELMLMGKGDDDEEADEPSTAANPAAEERAAGKARNRELITKYCQSPDPSSTLIIRAGKSLGTLKLLLAAAEKCGSVEKCEELGEADAVAFAIRKATESEATLEPRAAAMLVDRTGTDLGRIDCEVAKLAVASIAVAKLKPGTKAGVIDTALVAQMTGLSGEEAIFEFQRILLNETPEGALQELRTFRVVYRHDPVALSIFVCRLMQQLEGVARAIAAGESFASFSGRLKLWGPGGQAVAQIAEKLGQRTAARLLADALEADVGMKSGGNADMLLEVIVMRISRAINRVKGGAVAGAGRR